jgi:hypothetical protein
MALAQRRALLKNSKIAEFDRLMKQKFVRCKVEDVDESFWGENLWGEDLWGQCRVCEDFQDNDDVFIMKCCNAVVCQKDLPTGPTAIEHIALVITYSQSIMSK